MSAEAIGWEWPSLRIEVCAWLPDDVFVQTTPGRMFVSPRAYAIVRFQFGPRPSESLFAPDLDTPRDAAPEGWR